MHGHLQVATEKHSSQIKWGWEAVFSAELLRLPGIGAKILVQETAQTQALVPGHR